MLVVVGTQLDRAPRFWNEADEWYLPQVKAIMVSYAHFHKSKNKRKAAMEKGLHNYLGVKADMRVFLDNGAFAFWRNGIEPPIHDYVEFVAEAKPDWYPIPTDYITSPDMNTRKQRGYYKKTMQLNLEYASRGFNPVIHVGDWLEEYINDFEKHGLLCCKEIALGGHVPRLLTTKGSVSRNQAIDAIINVRRAVRCNLHLFGIGGLGTLHLAACLGVDSIDSTGWRSRAGRGLIFIPGKGERSVVPLTNWGQKSVSDDDISALEFCQCPACQRYGVEGLRASNNRHNTKDRGRGMRGFNSRAIHNLCTLLKEADEIDMKMRANEYNEWYPHHFKSPVLLRLIEHALYSSEQDTGKTQSTSATMN